MNNSWWWWFWMGSLAVLLVAPLTYGWGYRGWGPPYPRYYQRRRLRHAEAGGKVVTFDHQAWGLGGDVVWFLFSIGIVMIVVTVWPFRSP